MDDLLRDALREVLRNDADLLLEGVHEVAITPAYRGPHHATPDRGGAQCAVRTATAATDRASAGLLLRSPIAEDETDADAASPASPRQTQNPPSIRWRTHLHWVRLLGRMRRRRPPTSARCRIAPERNLSAGSPVLRLRRTESGGVVRPQVLVQLPCHGSRPDIRVRSGPLVVRVVAGDLYEAVWVLQRQPEPQLRHWRFSTA